MADSETTNTRWKRVDHANTVLAIIVSLIAIGGAISGLTIFVVTHTSATPGKPGASHGSPTATATSSGSVLFAETAGGEAHTWTNYLNAGGTQGPTIDAYQTIQVACKVHGFKVSDGNTWWYRIASSPWNNQYYVSADAFYNNGQTSGSLADTYMYPVDNKVADC